jgi:hypothetical protein
LTRKVFLRLSAILQVAALALFLGVYLLQGTVVSLAALDAPQNHRLLASSPSYWFFALFNQLNGTLPPALSWLAERAWIGLAIAVSGAVASLLLCYLRTMRKIVEEPDLVPGSRRSHWGHILADSFKPLSCNSASAHSCAAASIASSSPFISALD